MGCIVSKFQPKSDGTLFYLIPIKIGWHFWNNKITSFDFARHIRLSHRLPLNTYGHSSRWVSKSCKTRGLKTDSGTLCNWGLIRTLFAAILKYTVVFGAQYNPCVRQLRKIMQERSMYEVSFWGLFRGGRTRKKWLSPKYATDAERIIRKNREMQDKCIVVTTTYFLFHYLSRFLWSEDWNRHHHL